MLIFIFFLLFSFPREVFAFVYVGLLETNHGRFVLVEDKKDQIMLCDASALKDLNQFLHFKISCEGTIAKDAKEEQCLRVAKINILAFPNGRASKVGWLRENAGVFYLIGENNEDLSPTIFPPGLFNLVGKKIVLDIREVALNFLSEKVVVSYFVFPDLDLPKINEAPSN